MKMDQTAGSGNDEFYTPKYAVDPIIKYLKPNSKVWCPFDTKESLFVKRLREEGHSVVATHLSQGEDFFELDIECDAIISNPPYSVKGDVFESLFKRETPFAMLVGVVGLFESERRFTLFEQNPFEIMYMNRRVSYFRSYEDDKPALNPPYSSVYVTRDLLPDRICFERIDKRDVK